MPVLLGSAMLGAVAAGLYPDLVTAMPALSQVATRCEPNEATRTLHEARYASFLALQSAARDIRLNEEKARAG